MNESNKEGIGCFCDVVIGCAMALAIVATFKVAGWILGL